MSAHSVNVAELEKRLFINGEFVNSVSGKAFPTVDPATEEVICEVQEADEADVEKAVAAANAAFALRSPWREMDASGRRDLMLKLCGTWHDNPCPCAPPHPLLC
jgi:acyl-CoA reductase-like NAD-dependent aldehyde dehydrogenase